MTRINSAIKVSMLTDEHLLAEHREIKRLPSVYLKRKESKIGLTDLPKHFTLGTGHVLFFIDKPEFTFGRYLDIYNECTHRGFNVENYSSNWNVYKSEYNNPISNNYTPSNQEYNLLIERITERLLGSKKPYWHYYGRQISKEEAIKLLTNEKQ